MPSSAMKALPKLTREQGYFWILLLFWHLAFISTFSFLFSEWLESHVYSYGPLIWGYSHFLIWKQRAHYARFNTSNSLFGGACFAIVGFTWLAASITGIQVVQQLAFIGILCSAVLILGGWHLARALFFPLLLLLFTTEVWNFFQYPLRELSTAVTTDLVRLFGIPVLREDYLLTVPGGRFMVEPECSGLSFFMTSCLLVLIFSYEKALSIKSTLLFFGFAVFISILSNWLRILIIVIVGNKTEMQSVLVHEHLLFGWVVYAIAMIPLFVVGYIIFIKAKKSATNSTRPQRENNSALQKSHKNIPFILILSLFIALPMTTRYLLQVKDNSTLSETGHQLTNSKKIEETQSFRNWQPYFHNSDSQHYFYYSKGVKRIEVFIAQYFSQTQDKELVNKLNQLYDNKKWQEIEREKLSFINGKQTINGTAIQLLSHTGAKKVLFYWFEHGSLTAGSGTMAKLNQLQNVLLGNGTAGTAYAFMIPAELANEESQFQLPETILKELN